MGDWTRETQEFVGGCLLCGAEMRSESAARDLGLEPKFHVPSFLQKPSSAALPAAASRGVSSSPHPSAAILGVRLRLRVTIRMPVFMPEAANYTSRPPPQSRHLLYAHVELQFPENSTKLAKPRPRKCRLRFRQLLWAGGVRLPGCRRSCAREARAG